MFSVSHCVLLWVTTGYSKLLQVTKGYYMLLKVTTIEHGLNCKLYHYTIYQVLLRRIPCFGRCFVLVSVVQWSHSYCYYIRYKFHDIFWSHSPQTPATTCLLSGDLTHLKCHRDNPKVSLTDMQKYFFFKIQRQTEKHKYRMFGKYDNKFCVAVSGPAAADNTPSP